MKNIIKKLFDKLTREHNGKVPTNMQDLRGRDPCWCGSEKTYKKCHRAEDRKREQELGLGRRGKTICDAFT